MSASKAMGRLVLVVFLFGASGCYTFGLLQSDLPPSPEGADPELTIRVTTFDGERTTLVEPWVDRSVVGGVMERALHEPESVEIPLAEVDLIEEREFDKRRVLAIVAVLLGALVATVGCGNGGC
jgi:hypothetical protein